MADQNRHSRRGPPVSYSGYQQEDVEHDPAAEIIQRVADAMIANTHSHARRYSDSLYHNNQGTNFRTHEPRTSAQESADYFMNLGDYGARDRAVRQRGPSRNMEARRQYGGSSQSTDRREPSREPFPTFYAFPPPSDTMPGPRRSEPAISSHERRRRDSDRSSYSLAVDMPPRIASWSPTNDLAAPPSALSRSRSDSASPIEFPDDRRHVGHRPLTGTTHIDRHFSYTPRHSYVPAVDYGNDHVYESVQENDMHPATKSGAFGASNATTLLQPQSYQMLPREEKNPVPVSIQVGQYTYVREDAQADWQAELQRQLNEKPPPEKTKFQKLFHEVAFVFVIAVAQALMLAGVAQALVPAAIIGTSFGYDRPADLAWFSAAYALTAGTFVLPAGRLGDLFGHKKIFVIGFFWFAVWSFITAFAEQVNQNGGQGAIYFNICRAFQGIGPAMQVPNGQAMLGRAYEPGPRKALVMSLLGAAAPFGFVVGGTMASLFSELVIWPWAFWTLAAVCIGFGCLSILVLPNSPVEKRNKRESLWMQLDATGILLGVSGLVLFNFSWNQAALVSWSTPYTYFLLIISLMLLAAFVFAELHAPYPLVPISAMQSQTNFVLACTAVGWGCFSIWVFYGVQFLELLRGWSPLVTSAALAPAPVTGLVASLLVARYMMRVGPHWIMLISMVAFFVGSLLMSTAPVKQIYWGNTFFSILIMPFGMDMSNPAATIILSNSVGKQHQGIAASLVVTVVNYSISTALGFAATIETHVNHGGSDVLAGFRGAQYFSVGLGVLGCLIALAFALTTIRRQHAEAADPLRLQQTEPLSRDSGSFISTSPHDR